MRRKTFVGSVDRRLSSSLQPSPSLPARTSSLSHRQVQNILSPHARSKQVQSVRRQLFKSLWTNIPNFCRHYVPKRRSRSAGEYIGASYSFEQQAGDSLYSDRWLTDCSKKYRNGVTKTTCRRGEPSTWLSVRMLRRENVYGRTKTSTWAQNLKISSKYFSAFAKNHCVIAWRWVSRKRSLALKLCAKKCLLFCEH